MPGTNKQKLLYCLIYTSVIFQVIFASNRFPLFQYIAVNVALIISGDSNCQYKKNNRFDKDNSDHHSYSLKYVSLKLYEM